MKTTTKKIKLKFKTGDLVKVLSGKWKGLEDYVFKIDTKKQLVYLKQANRVVYDKTPAKKPESIKKTICTPLRICKVAKQTT